jgi:hypothetical protein
MTQTVDRPFVHTMHLYSIFLLLLLLFFFF